MTARARRRYLLVAFTLIALGTILVLLLPEPAPRGDIVPASTTPPIVRSVP